MGQAREKRQMLVRGGGSRRRTEPNSSRSCAPTCFPSTLSHRPLPQLIILARWLPRQQHAQRSWPRLRCPLGRTAPLPMPLPDLRPTPRTPASKGPLASSVNSPTSSARLRSLRRPWTIRCRVRRQASSKRKTGRSERWPQCASASGRASSVQPSPARSLRTSRRTSRPLLTQDI